MQRIINTLKIVECEFGAIALRSVQLQTVNESVSQPIIPLNHTNITYNYNNNNTNTNTDMLCVAFRVEILLSLDETWKKEQHQAKTYIEVTVS